MLNPDRTKGNAPTAATGEALEQQTPVSKEFDMNGSTVLRFQETAFNVVDRNGHPWLRSPQIAEALGYNRSDRLADVYSRHADEFTNNMTAVVKLPDLNPQSAGEGQMREVRIFSPRGCYALGMFARTKVAKDFRVWVLDVLEGKAAVPPAPTLPAPKTITTAQAGELVTLVAERFPDGRSRGYAWSRFNAHFRIARYRELPASRFAEACAYIRGMPAKDGSDPALSLIASRVENARFMLTFNEEGRIMLREVPEQALFIEPAEFAKVLREPGGVPLRLLPEIVGACAERLGAVAAAQRD